MNLPDKFRDYKKRTELTYPPESQPSILFTRKEMLEALQALSDARDEIEGLKEIADMVMIKESDIFTQEQIDSLKGSK